MALYGQMVVTQLGQILYAKAQTGKPLVYTRMRIGSGQYSGDPTALTDLVQPIGYIPLSSMSQTGQTAHIKGVFQNTDITDRIYSCEIGLYAQDPDGSEILYAYANAGGNGDIIPPIAAGPFSREFQLNVAVGNASNVTVNIPSTAFTTVSDFEKHVNDKNLHMTRSEIETRFTVLEVRVQALENSLANDMRDNQFAFDFASINGLIVDAGWWDQANARLGIK
ncbi:hypothetical protein [Brevibacillus reuszeri]|uniref:hypothetical protein n=1 Tax=Brevibacillus reuszeri TaxID=54915 RepID=UPI000CCC40EE|nr:hypothetical protein [Brevibacillus reuszeri]